jgi:Tfp pilus assembly protein PilE
MVTVAIMGVLVAISAPHLGRSLEQSRADFAVANLRAIWAAQRLYWLENHTYADQLTQATPPALYELGLLDPSIVAAGDYSYSIVSWNANTFSAQAVRAPSAGWTGAFTINQDGTIGGSISAGGTTITPGFQ